MHRHLADTLSCINDFTVFSEKRCINGSLSIFELKDFFAAIDAFVANKTRSSFGFLRIRLLIEQLMQDLDLPAISSATRTNFSKPHLHLHNSLAFVETSKSSSGVHVVLGRASRSLDLVASLHRLS